MGEVRRVRGVLGTCCFCNRNRMDPLIGLDEQFWIEGSAYKYKCVAETCFCFLFEMEAGSTMALCRRCAHQLELTWAFFMQIRNAQAELSQAMPSSSHFTTDIKEIVKVEKVEIDFEQNLNQLKEEDSSSDIGDTLQFSNDDAEYDDAKPNDISLKMKNTKHNANLNLNQEYVCDLCSKVFKSKSLLRYHLLVHNDVQIECKLCGKLFSQQHGLQKHMREDHHSKPRYMCTKCPEVFPKAINIKEHRRIIHQDKYGDYFKFRLVTIEENGKDTLKNMCFTCGEIIQDLQLFEHMAGHSLKFICHVCAKEFRNSNNLNSHLKTHTHDGVPCDMCDKVFKQAEYIRLHKLIAHSNKSELLHKCPLCPERFQNYTKRQKHLIGVHGQAPRVYKCKICSKEYRAHYSLSRHMNSHHMARSPYECPECGAQKRDRKQLAEHMVTHTGAKDFKCEVCGKCFGRKKTLMEHLKIHYNIRKFSCAHCDSTFIQKCSLKSHMKKHGKYFL